MMINPYRTAKKSKSLFLLTVALIVIIVLYGAAIRFMNHPNPSNVDDQTNESRASFVPTLRGKKIFFGITTVGLGSFWYLENMIDSVRDLCEAGATVSFHITSSNCNPYLIECEIKNQNGNETLEDNFSVETISHLNERLRCRNPEGSIDLTIHLVSPDWGKQICDHHRLLFYEHIDEFDVFVHTEDDHLIRPTHVIAFMHEMEKVRKLVGDERLSDYSIGFVRYENQVGRFDNRRAVWEFEWDSEVDMVNHPGIEGRYFTTPPWHHQGMFMATKQQLIAWKTRGPDCHFHKIERRSGWHRERITGALDLYNEEYCNVTQLLPLDSFEDLLIHHMPNRNYNRKPLNIVTTRNLHKMRMKAMQSINKSGKIWVDDKGEYNGIIMINDERDPTKPMHFNFTEYDEYVSRGGRLSEEQLVFWEWPDPNAQKYYEMEVRWED